MDEEEKARLFEEGRNAARNGLDVDRAVGNDPDDQAFRDGYIAERREEWERAQELVRQAQQGE